METLKVSKRKQLMDKGKELFLKFSPKRITVEEVCRESNVSKVTFYKYFKNKSDLTQAIREEMVETGFSKFDEISRQDIPFIDKIQLMSKWRMEFLSKIQGEFLDELIEFDKFAEESKKRFLKNIKTAQDKGEIRSELSIDLIWLMIEKLHEITLSGEWRKYIKEYSEYQDQLRTIIFFGMLTNKEK
jgi:AcrR family transcriptional regulator